MRSFFLERLCRMNHKNVRFSFLRIQQEKINKTIFGNYSCHCSYPLCAVICDSSRETLMYLLIATFIIHISFFDVSGLVRPMTSRQPSLQVIDNNNFREMKAGRQACPDFNLRLVTLARLVASQYMGGWCLQGILVYPSSEHKAMVRWINAFNFGTLFQIHFIAWMRLKHDLYFLFFYHKAIRGPDQKFH